MMNDKKLRQVLLALETASQNDAVREARAAVLTEMECRKRRDPNPGYLQRDFKEKGGIVHDANTTETLLRTLPRGGGPPPGVTAAPRTITGTIAVNVNRVGRLRADGRQNNDDVVLRIQRNALLVGSHALRPVLETLNEQHLYWERRDPKVIEAERASIQEMLMEQAREEDTAEVNGSIDPDSTKEN